MAHTTTVHTYIEKGERAVITYGLVSLEDLSENNSVGRNQLQIAERPS
jgi:hypothetical protein